MVMEFAYLHHHGVVHRDLAVRNVLAFRFDDQNWKVILVKLTDYGLSLFVTKGYTGGTSAAEVTTNSTNAAGPTRWMAEESLKRRVYSKKSDVWAFGVLLWEISTLAMLPYNEIANDTDVVRAVLEGERLPRPDKCSDQQYAIMQDCWKSAQTDRPDMSEIQKRLQEAFAAEMLEASKSECVVCMSAEPVTALMPCGHLCVCEECGSTLSTCPICRTPVQEAKRIFGI